MQNMSKLQEVILNLLEVYKEMTFLWDKEHKDYKNKELRNEGYSALLEIFKEYDQNATVKVLVKKIQNLRTNYLKELHKVKESRLKSTCEEDVYVPTLFYFDALTFLGDTGDFRQTRDPLKSEDQTWSSDEDNGSQSPKITPAKKQKVEHKNHAPKTEYIVVQAKHKMKDEDCEILGKAIGLQLRDLDKKNLAITQKLISDTIYYANMGLLNENSYVCLGTARSRSSSPSTSQKFV